jgi:hypothetical protein
MVFPLELPGSDAESPNELGLFHLHLASVFAKIKAQIMFV